MDISEANGAFGSPQNLAKIGKKATTAHTHSLRHLSWTFRGWNFNEAYKGLDIHKGPSSWSHSHVVLYGNGQRSIVTVKNGKWRA